ncbi:MAG: DUF378 domain-containing protein [Clostridiales bacterium]|nr:DUF378 domain-containing protein [Clostridiales bacterium]
MKTTTIISFILVLVGAIVWLFVGVFGINLVSFLTGSLAMVANVVYILVGLAGLWLLFWSLTRKPFREL